MDSILQFLSDCGILLRTYNHSITTLAKQQDFLLFVVTGT